VFLGAAGDKQGEFWGYRYVTDEESTKLSGLSEDERGVYNLVEREGNRGIWFRDLKRRTPIEHARLTKLLKTLVARKLIKQENSVQGKNRKVYMLFDLEPAREVTGGAFHSGHELDLEFVEQLSKVALVYLKKFTLATTYEILEYIKSVGLSNVALSLEDTQVRLILSILLLLCVLPFSHYHCAQTVLSTLVYDGQVELVPPARVPLLWQNRIAKEQEMAASKAAVGAKRSAAQISEPELTEEDLVLAYL
jgi:DNA-binding MarR family transcriptional regulator